MVKNILLFLILLLSTSCARILNKETARIKIYSETPVKVIFKKDTIPVDGMVTLNPLRKKDSLKFHIIDKDTATLYSISSHNSAAFILNISTIPLYGLGYLFDARSDKRYGYPPKVWIKNNIALDYNHKNPKFNFQNIIKVSITDFFSLDGFTKASVNYERRINNKISLGLGVSQILNLTYHTKIEGFGVNAEQKFYLKNNVPIGNYFATAFSYFDTKLIKNMTFINSNIDFVASPFFSIIFFPFGGYDNRSYQESVLIDRKMFTTSLLYGKQYRLVNRIFLDANIGVGLKYREITHLNRSRPNDEIKDPILKLLNYNKDIAVGKHWSYYIPLNIKIGYSF